MSATEHQLKMAAAQRVTCSCALCGELLGEDLTLRESRELFAAHRRDVHGLSDLADQQAGNQRRQEEADKHLLDVMDREWRSLRDLSARAEIAEVALRKRLTRLEVEGKVERDKQGHNDSVVFRLA